MIKGIWQSQNSLKVYKKAPFIESGVPRWCEGFFISHGGGQLIKFSETDVDGVVNYITKCSLNSNVMMG